MVSPWRRKNCGRKITKPKINVLIVINTQEPTIKRCSSGGFSMSDALTCGTGAGTSTGGSVPPPADSFSIACIKDSASAVRPCDSSQRGDSGRFLRRYQTISEPRPAMTNIGRHPQAGMIR